MEEERLNVILRAVFIIGAVLLIIYGLQFYGNRKQEIDDFDTIRIVSNGFSQILLQAHDEWKKVGGGTGVRMNFLANAVDDVIFNTQGWPYGASDGKTVPIVNFESQDATDAELDQSCAQIFNNLLVNTKVRSVPSHAPCKAEFCALAEGDRCRYLYAKSPENGFSYRPSNGNVEAFFTQRRSGQ